MATIPPMLAFNTFNGGDGGGGGHMYTACSSLVCSSVVISYIWLF